MIAGFFRTQGLQGVGPFLRRGIVINDPLHDSDIRLEVEGVFVLPEVTGALV